MKKIFGILALAFSMNAFAEHVTLVILDAEQRIRAFEIANRLVNTNQLSVSVIDCTKLANNEVCIDLHKNHEKAGIVSF